ncbi:MULTISPECIES: hypothetical protein [Planktothricoides]|uniref:Uncharacterized protein n=1 Tax=Planktothricoides raciborskii GIHE-MW2 TaxID=2792601 RepID=A0AAU8JBU2_9CYAN|nr:MULTISPECIES: hypothetical protein [Planktothricoides]
MLRPYILPTPALLRQKPPATKVQKATKKRSPSSHPKRRSRLAF